MKTMYIRMPDDLHKAVRHEAVEEDESGNACVVKLISEALEARRSLTPTH